MRLTLRRMLAYMDNILGPEEGQVIAKKIEDSEVATNLLHRTRDVMRRLRLGAPDIMDREKGLDPNTVAEYLDHMLPDERVADFEKVCLESEMHLAEAASCHQVLALVLGEPAEVEPDSRQRMYQMPEVLAQRMTAEATEVTETSEPLATGERPAYLEDIELPYGAKPPIPEYLRRSRRHRLLWPVSAAVALFALLVVLLAATEQFQPGTFLGDMLGLQSADTVVFDDTGISNDTAVLEPPFASIASADELTEDKRDMASPDRQEEPSSRPPLPPETAFVPSSLAEPSPSAVPASPADAVGSQVDQGMPVPTAKFSSPQSETAGRPDPADIASSTRPDERSPVDLRDRSSAARDSTADPAASPPGTPLPGTPLPGTPLPGTPLPGTPPAEPLPQTGQPVGVAAAADEILLRLEAGDRWHRLSDQSPLAAADRLLSLPTFRPSLLLGDTIGLQLIDGTQLQLQPPDQQGTPGIILETGRIVIEPMPGGPTVLRVQIGEITGLLGFEEGDTVVAISASRSGEGVEGDPETQPGALSATMFVTTGSCRWMGEASLAPVVIRSPAQCLMSGRLGEVVPLPEIPGWIEPDTADGLEGRASWRIEQAVGADGHVGLRLKELAEDRQPEVGWLAIRCLGWIGDFDLLVAMLNDREQKRNWPACFEQLRGAVMRSPTTAAQVRTEMEWQHGSGGAALYEMLWGYRGDGELSQEDAARLIGYLEHETLAFRVLGFLNLHERTGLGFFYSAEDSAASRQRPVQRWKERFRRG